jgi:hypothetical protein
MDPYIQFELFLFRAPQNLGLVKLGPADSLLKFPSSMFKFSGIISRKNMLPILALEFLFLNINKISVNILVSCFSAIPYASKLQLWEVTTLPDAHGEKINMSC